MSLTLALIALVHCKWSPNQRCDEAFGALMWIEGQLTLEGDWTSGSQIACPTEQRGSGNERYEPCYEPSSNFSH
jgi:hypothetical protein